jgi:hypothetical protein
LEEAYYAIEMLTSDLVVVQEVVVEELEIAEERSLSGWTAAKEAGHDYSASRWLLERLVKPDSEGKIPSQV